MGGRGYHNDVKGYLNSNKRTMEYAKINEISNDKIDFIIDSKSPSSPVAPEFSNSPGKIYALVSRNGKSIKSITVYNKDHTQKYSIHLDHPHNGKTGIHVHSGMLSGRNDIKLTQRHISLANKVTSIYENWRKRKWLKKIWIWWTINSLLKNM